MDTVVTQLFERYERAFNKALLGNLDMDEVADLYASEFIAASPAGVKAGKNDAELKQVMAQGYARYRALETKEMRIRGVRISRINDDGRASPAPWGRFSTFQYWSVNGQKRPQAILPNSRRSSRRASGIRRPALTYSAPWPG